MKKILAIVTGMIGIFLVIAGVITKAKKAVSFSIIGGADGPTSVFVAGKVGSGISVSLIVLGAILIAIMIMLWLRRQRK